MTRGVITVGDVVIDVLNKCCCNSYCYKKCTTGGVIIDVL